MAEQTAESDLAAKLRLERGLQPQLRKVDQGLAREVVQSLRAGGPLPNISGLTQVELTPILLEHYETTGEFFGNRLRPGLSSGAASTAEEDAEIAALLATFYAQRAPSQAERIGVTNQADAEFSQRTVLTERDQRASEGLPFTQAEVAVATGTLFALKLRGRERARVMFETQVATEHAKMVEVRVLVPSTVTVVTKMWQSQGDSKVRPPHLDADGQERGFEVAFDVGGQQLRYPGDTTLGATAENVVGCRCSSITSQAQVEAARS